MNSLMKMPIVVNDTMLPVRVVPPKYWMTGTCYLRRVQKKWTKRFGMKPLISNGVVLEGNGSFYMNSATYEEVKSQFSAQELWR